MAENNDFEKVPSTIITSNSVGHPLIKLFLTTRRSIPLKIDAFRIFYDSPSYIAPIVGACCTSCDCKISFCLSKNAFSRSENVSMFISY